MKKLFAAIILFTQFSCTKPPQDSLTLKVQFQPEKKYSLTTERTSQTVIKYSGQEIALRKFKQMGIKNPTISEKKIRREYRVTTDKTTDQTSFPCTVELIKTTTIDGKTDNSDGAIFRGHCLVGNMPTFDSVVKDGLDKDDKKALIQAIENTFSQLSLPEKKLKIGELFSVEHPLSMPMEGSTVEMEVTTNYKLISILNDIASFDISQTYIMNPTLLNNSFKGTGSGNGQLLYDIENKIALKNTLDTEIEINKKLDYFEFDLSTKARFVQTTAILTK